MLSIDRSDNSCDQALLELAFPAGLFENILLGAVTEMYPYSAGNVNTQQTGFEL